MRSYLPDLQELHVLDSKQVNYLLFVHQNQRVWTAIIWLRTVTGDGLLY